MAYRDDIGALSPDHFWTWDGVHSDIGDGSSAPRNTNQTGGNSATLNAPAIAEDAGQSLFIPNLDARTECADSNQINSTAQPRRTMGGWFLAPPFVDTVTHVYKEGGGTNNITIWMFPGNFIMCQAIGSNVNPDINKQVFGGRQLTPGRVYHIAFRFEGGTDFWFFIDGIPQGNSVGSVGTSSVMPGHGGDINWGDSDSNLRMGAALSFRGGAAVGSRYNHWASWTDALSDQVIRETLFERGALPTHTITSQAQLDALANVTISETPLAIRVDVSGSISLDASNIIFDQASIHVQYMGTGTLTWTNGGVSNASLASTPNGGAVVFSKSRTLTFTGLPDGVEVRVRRGVQTLAHDQNITGGSFSYEYLFAASVPVSVTIGGVGWVRIELTVDLENFDQVVPLSFEPDPPYV